MMKIIKQNKIKSLTSWRVQSERDKPYAATSSRFPSRQMLEGNSGLVFGGKRVVNSERLFAIR
jgi:hypothetical protein